MTQAQNQEEITNWDSVPGFETEEEEQAFWDNHCLGDNILEQMQPVERPPSGKRIKTHKAD